MVALTLKSFGGIAPIVPPRYLQDNQAQVALNCPVFQGSIQALVSHPFKAYQILCDTSTSAERLVGKLVNIPMERETAEFDGRIVLSARN